MNGEVKNEIPFSDYYENTVTISSPSDSYRYEVVGTGEGSYKLTVTFVAEEETDVFTAIDIDTSAEAIHQYTIDWDALSQGEKGVTIQIDSDGDGNFDHSTSIGNELTWEEFTKITANQLPFWIWLAAGAGGLLVLLVMSSVLFRAIRQLSGR